MAAAQGHPVTERTGAVPAGAYLAALATAALSLAAGYAGVLLLAVAAVSAAVWATDRVSFLSPPLERLTRTLQRSFAGVDRLVLLRILVSGCHGLTVILTWPLWGPRDYPPLLPMAGLPQVHYGLLLLGSLVLVVAAPRIGIGLHLLTLAGAIFADQTRMQPEVVSLSALLVATNVPGWGLTVGKAHLASMWLWAGVHKVLSVGFMDRSAQWIYAGLPFELGALRDGFGWMIAGTELATGLLVLIPSLRRLGVVLALCLHGMILIVLSGWNHDWNQSVWPWNLALGFAAVALFWPFETEPAAPGASRRGGAVGTAIAAVVALYPLGFYLGVSDAYLSHHLYSDAVAVAYCEPVSCRSADFGDTWDVVDVPLPPEPRLYRQWFLGRCNRGEVLVLIPRQTKVLLGRNSDEQRIECPKGRA